MKRGLKDLLKESGYSDDEIDFSMKRGLKDQWWTGVVITLRSNSMKRGLKGLRVSRNSFLIGQNSMKRGLKGRRCRMHCQRF